jgi:DNA polymerase-3 subunit alpha
MMGDDAHGSSTQEPDLVEAVPWGVKERLTQEKRPWAFTCRATCSTRWRARCAALPHPDRRADRQPRAADAGGHRQRFRVINGQRGKLGLFKLDDKSGVIEASADEALLNTYRNQLKEDEFVVMMGRLQLDHFSGFGLRVKVQQVWDWPVRAAASANTCHVVVGDGRPKCRVWCRSFRPAVKTEQGDCAAWCAASREQGAAVAELQLGDASRFYPTDAALAAWSAQVGTGSAVVSTSDPGIFWWGSGRG